MKSLLSEINKSIGKNDDLYKWSQDFGNIQVVLVGLSSLIDFPKTIQLLEGQIQTVRHSSEVIVQQLHKIGKVKSEKKEIIEAIFEGELIIFIDELGLVISIDPVPKTLNRSIESPSSDNNIQGPLSAFNEDLSTNIGLLRKEFSSVELQVSSYTFGNSQKKGLSLLYCKDQVNNKLVENVTKQVESNLDKMLYTIQDVTKMLGLPKYSLISSFNTTESPQEVYSNLVKGRVVLFLDRLPYALILPSTLWDMFAIRNDENYSFVIMIALRLLRVIGAITALVLPGLYVALVAVNPEMLRIELALSVAKTREGVPYPAFVEVILMLVILELIIEASVRLPKSIGPTVTMVGGIVLGQAAVDARLVSNLLIIILAASTIASSTIVGFQNSFTIRIFKYNTLVLASIFGVLGVFTGLFLVCAYIASKTTLGIPYLSVKGEMKSG
ncbi:spore germination protein [Aquibacillus koreensis]|uniref:Spore germination protein n=1 Tax=Aquibacillus koreensis TaxID=279446 RepID=A0A9X3WHM0_9BACI|nr:spore germination protein [Aquibacillus koreensis]MCT2537105.1 spore germination protein [Aquibacillus koreensis]MDC3419912.1 spore germination protein [Aquibacillus koreensis]